MDKIDWNNKSVPTWANYAAMDASGLIYVYRIKPTIGITCWWCADGYYECVGYAKSARWKESLQERVEMKMDDKILTFGELCEAIRDGKVLQYLDGWTWKDNHLLTDKREIRSIVYYANKDKYRIKPEAVKRYQWLIAAGIHKYELTNNRFSKTEAEERFGIKIIEPYLPSERIDEYND